MCKGTFMTLHDGRLLPPQWLPQILTRKIPDTGLRKLRDLNWGLLACLLHAASDCTLIDMSCFIHF